MVKFVKTLFTHFYADDLSSDEKVTIERHILMRNWVRAKIVFLIIFLSEIALIIFVDLPIFSSQDATYRDVDLWYFLMHILIGVYGVIGYFVSRYFGKQFRRTSKGKQEALLYILAFGLLFFLTMINSFDQLTTNQITVFVIYVILSGFVLLFKPGVDMGFYLLTYVFFAIGVSIYQDDATILNSHIVNGAFMVVGALVVSKLTYYNYYVLYAKTLKLNQANQELSYLSSHDSLTQLPNRRYFYQQLNELEEMNPHLTGYLLLVDFDDFKKINDQHGHQVGDRILEEVGVLFKEVVGNDYLVARFGGEEFMFFLPLVKEEVALDFANELCKSIKNYAYECSSYDIIVTVSIGVSEYDGAHEHALDLSYKKADDALYEAKQKGKNQVIFLTN